jgi:hypothetical protein
MTVRPSCVSDNDFRFAGDPAVRLTSVVSAVSCHYLGSICNTEWSRLFSDPLNTLLDPNGHGP